MEAEDDRSDTYYYREVFTCRMKQEQDLKDIRIFWVESCHSIIIFIVYQYFLKHIKLAKNCKLFKVGST